MLTGKSVPHGTENHGTLARGARAPWQQRNQDPKASVKPVPYGTEKRHRHRPHGTEKQGPGARGNQGSIHKCTLQHGMNNDGK